VLREGDVSLCQKCADLNLVHLLDHLEFLQPGDSALTQRATKYSELVVIYKDIWEGGSRKFGIFVEPEALERARKECEAAREIRAVKSYLMSEPKF